MSSKVMSYLIVAWLVIRLAAMYCLCDVCLHAISASFGQAFWSFVLLWCGFVLMFIAPTVIARRYRTANIKK